MISLENVRLKFDSRGIAGLSGVSLSLTPGTITALMGPNGSGKTTLLRILAGDLKPDSGLVNCEKTAFFRSAPELNHEQNVQKYLTGKVPAEIDDDKKIQLSRDLADIFEFTFQLRQKMGELSAGQKQKVLIAGELIGNPKLVLLDEPFTHLDPHTRKDILVSLFQYVKRQNLTLLWVTHDLNEGLRFSDKTILLHHGKIEQEGTPEDLIRHPRNIFAAQFVGYHNFFPVKKSGSLWLTPWGEMDFSHAPKSEEAIMIVPDNGWDFDSSSPIKARIGEIYFQGTLRTIEASLEDRTITISGYDGEAKPGQLLGLKPASGVSFLIGL
jgi:ABC-type Fe3+/spermidine/putrescine transport system ATPase subunit